MGNTVGRFQIIGICDIVEEDHRIVLGSVQPTPSERANGATYTFLIRLPRDVGIVKESNKVLRRALMIGVWISVIIDAKIGSCLQPQIVRFAWVIPWRIEVLFSV